MTEVPKSGVPKEVPKDVLKSEVPKIVYDRLRTAAPEPDSNAVVRAHPDADLLTAFAEQALSAPEREEVLRHLALCGNCREVLSLADVLSLAIESVNDSVKDSVNSVDAPPVPISTESEPEFEPVQTASIRFAARKNWRPVFAWPNLRWAGLAAGVAIVATVLVLHSGKQNHAAQSATSPSIVASVPGSAGSEVTLPSSNQSTSNEPFSNQSVSNQSTVAAKSDKAQNAAESPWSKNANLSTEPRFAARIADNKKSKSNVAPFAGDALMARNYAPAIEKAKPALQPQETQTTGAIGTTATTATNAQQKTDDTTGLGSAGLGSTPSPETSAAAAVINGPRPGSPSGDVPMQPAMWAVAAGVLQRSVDAGQTWQITLRADRPLLAYASRDQDVWAGGEAGALFHSADSGATWTQVQPSIKGQTLSSDITQIDISNSDVSNNDFRNGKNNDKLYRRQNLEHIVVLTGSHEVWRSADGGITWNKQ
jgi:Putative zinc-finger